jgi:hypothetical protein
MTAIGEHRPMRRLLIAGVLALSMFLVSITSTLGVNFDVLLAGGDCN